MQNLIIPLPTLENFSLLVGFIAFCWSAFQELRHKAKFGFIFTFKKIEEKKGLFCPKCGIQISSKIGESGQNFPREVDKM